MEASPAKGSKLVIGEKEVHMKRQICFALLVLLLWGGGFAQAEIITLPLPELAGSVGRHPNWDIANIDLGVTFSEIHSVRIQCSGTISPGVGCGDGVERPVFPYYDIPGVIEMFMEHPAIGSCITMIGPYSGSFSVEESFECTFNADWDILLDGQAELISHITSNLIVIGGVTLQPPTATISEATLIVDGFIEGSPLTLEEVERTFLLAGSSYAITWTDARSVDSCGGNYLLDYSTDNGATWIAITATPLSGSCSYDWAVPSLDSSECVLRITDADDAGVSDTTDTLFCIYQCQGPVTGDFDGSCYVDFNDFAYIAAIWLNEGGADLDDLRAFIDSWLSCGNPFDPVCQN